MRREARRLAEEQDADLIISDSPPGIGCPVTAAITGVDLVLAVTEPTPSGIHDLQRVAGLCGHSAMPLAVCINKHDINPGNSGRIRTWCEANAIEVAGEIPFDPALNRALVARWWRAGAWWTSTADRCPRQSPDCGRRYTPDWHRIEHVLPGLPGDG